MADFTQFTAGLSKIPIDAESVEIIDTPAQFYDLLIRLVKSAKQRITLSTLYIGIGSLEKQLVDEIDVAIGANKSLAVNILLDYLRGTRGEPNESSTKILRKLLPSASVHLFHTPNLRGFLKMLLPERVNEIIGLQHMKLYIFDNDIIISGANLSDTYFTNRQDRYIRIKNCKILCDFFDSLVNAVSSCSFVLLENGTIELDERCPEHPYIGDIFKYQKVLKERINDVFLKLLKTETDGKQHDTFLYPMLQIGTLSVNQEHRFLNSLFSTRDKCLSITMCSGYFNLVDNYAKLISDVGEFNMDIIFASPQANGFYKGSGLSGYIPALYVDVSKRFSQQAPHVKLFEYFRNGWSFHGKGLWISSTKSPFYATLVGSSNYGYRSLHRDLEAQLLIVTSNEGLKNKFRGERKRILEYSSAVEASTFFRIDHAVPLWLRLIARFVRNFF